MPTTTSSKRSKRSSVSFASFSTTSSTASTKASTVWGPGTLAGKAIEAFGEATLRGIEDVVIRRRLAALRSLFPHSDNTAIRNVDSVYKDVLELSRVDLYTKNINRAALQLILMQIAGRQTHHLRKGLQRWPIFELGIFLSQVMNTVMLGYEKWYKSLFGGEKRTATCGDGNDLVPMIEFIALVADDHLACQAALEGGFMDMLLRIYIFCPKLGRDTSALASACTSAMLVLSRRPEHLETIVHHPVCTLWATCREVFEMTAMLDDSISSRCTAWRRVEKPFVISRLVIIHRVLLSKSHLEKSATTDISIDLVEFSRSQFYDTEVVEIATLSMLTCVLTAGEHTQHLASAIMHATHQEVVDIFSRIIQLWVVYVQTRERPEMALQIQARNKGHGGRDHKTSDGSGRSPTQSTKSITANENFYDREKALLFRNIETIQRRAFPPDDRPLHNIMEFAMIVAKDSLISRWGILDAGILVLVPLAAVDGLQPLLSPLLDTLGQHTNCDACDATQLVIPLALVGTATSKLLSLIQEPLFQELLHSKIFMPRKSVCSALLDAFLGHGHDMNDRHSKIRNLFAQILAERDVSTHAKSGSLEGLMAPLAWQPFATDATYNSSMMFATHGGTTGCHPGAPRSAQPHIPLMHWGQ